MKRTRLARARKAVGLTQEDLAEALHVDRSTVIRWESGRSEPLPYCRPRLARLLAVNLEQLEALLAPEAPGDKPAGVALVLAAGYDERSPEGDPARQQDLVRVLSLSAGVEATGPRDLVLRAAHGSAILGSAVNIPRIEASTLDDARYSLSRLAGREWADIKNSIR